MDVLKNMENPKKHQRGMLPSSSTIENRIAALGRLADQNVPFLECVSSGGIPNIMFDYDSVLRCFEITRIGVESYNGRD